MVYTFAQGAAVHPESSVGPQPANASWSDQGICQACLRSPAAPLTAVKQTGMVLARRSTTLNAILCHSCGTAMFRQAQAHNLAFGWWGLISLVTNVFALAGNFSRYRKHRAIGASAGIPLRPGLNPGRPVWQRPQMIVPMALAAALGAALVSSAGHESVRGLQAGQCIDVPASGTFHDVELVPCTEPHDAEVAGVLTAGASTPDSGDACAELAAQNVLLSRVDDVDVSFFEPVAGSGQTHSSIRAVCLLTGLNDAKLTGHVTGS